MNMKKTALSILLAAAMVAPAMAQNIATVNGKPIPSARERVLVEQLQRANPGSTIDENQVKDNLITQEVLSQEAIKLGLDKTETYREQVEVMRRSLLIAALYENYVAKHPISDKDISAEYERMKTLMSTEYQARHILVATEEQAKDIINQINQGAKFADLATQYSLDKGTASEGGLLDWSPATTYVPQFAQALQDLKKGQLTAAPIQTQYGWHVIKLEDIRQNNAADFPALNDNIKAQLRDQMEQRGFLEYQEKLIQSADIKPVQ